MTNTLYFHGVVRDADSVSSSSLEDGQVEVVNMESPTLYSVIGKACLACARPQLEENNHDDDSVADVDDQVLDAHLAVNLQGVSNNWKLDGDITDISQCSLFKRFSLDELRTATRNFRPSAIMKGYSGLVYKGWVDEHTLTPSKLGMGISVAVRWLKQEECQSQTRWLEEVNSLGQLHHPNLVGLLGYCLENGHRLLVSEAVPSRRLGDHLFGRNSNIPPLSWTLRMKVALGAAKCLAFLHSAGRILHPNFEWSNIFVDMNHDAKLSGFMLIKESRTYPIGVMGTIYGDLSRSIDRRSTYASPEYLTKGSWTDKSDVYSFGVVLLEILSGRRAFDENRPSGQIHLVEWAKPYICQKGKVSVVLDFRLQGQYSPSVAKKVAKLSLQCLALETRLRPSMDEVVKALQELQG